MHIYIRIHTYICIHTYAYIHIYTYMNTWIRCESNPLSLQTPTLQHLNHCQCALSYFLRGTPHY